VNLGQLRVAVDQRTGIGLDPVAVNHFVAEALDAISAERDWPWLEQARVFTTAAGQDSYPVPSDWARTVSLRVGGREPLYRAASVDDLDYDDPELSAGEPDAFAVFGGQLVLRPVPDRIEVVTHRYQRRERELALDTDEPLLPATFHHAIAELAAALVCRRRGDAREASFAASYGAWRSRMIAEAARQRPKARVRTRGRW
jgi:hypothetical protein